MVSVPASDQDDDLDHLDRMIHGARSAVEREKH